MPRQPGRERRPRRGGVLVGRRERVTEIAGSRELVAAAVSTDKTLKIWDGQFHDLLHEPDADQVIAAVVSWIEHRSETAKGSLNP